MSSDCDPLSERHMEELMKGYTDFLASPNPVLESIRDRHLKEMKDTMTSTDKHFKEMNDLMSKTPFTPLHYYLDGTPVKIGDRVRRIKEYQNVLGWSLGDRVFEIVKLSSRMGSRSLKIGGGRAERWWDISKFEKIEIIKAGDKVRRKTDYDDGILWPFGQKVFEVLYTKVSSYTDTPMIVLESDDHNYGFSSWNSESFDKVKEESVPTEKFYMGIPLEPDEEVTLTFDSGGYDPKDLDVIRIGGKKFYHIPDDVAAIAHDDDVDIELGIATLMAEAWEQQEDAGFHFYDAYKVEEVDIPRALALIHSELSEALEGDRKALMDKHLPSHPQFEVELADAVIRIASLAASLDIDLGGIIVEKAKYNRTRLDHTLAERAKSGGKRY